jgi:hypothetical protein
LTWPAAVVTLTGDDKRFEGGMLGYRDRFVALAAGVCLVGAGCSAGSGPSRQAAAPAAETVVAPDRDAAVDAYGKLPMRFEANRGQIAPEVDFLARGRGYSVFLTGEEAVMSLEDGAVVRMRLEGADPAMSPRQLGEQTGATSYLRGAPETWVPSAPTYASVGYDGVWPGIDVVYRSAAAGFEYDFVVAPAADPGRIGMRFDGAQGIRVDEGGGLVIETPAGTVRHEPPFAFQEEGGTRTQIQARYQIAGPQNVRFTLGAYDPARPLVIDPVVAYSTYLGGPIGDAVNAIAVNPAGEVYAAGVTNSPDFPLVNALQGTKGGGTSNGNDAFITKFNAGGSGLVYSTFLGGTLNDAANAIAIDPAGNVYVAGTTISNDFPLANAIQAVRGVGTCPTSTTTTTAQCTDAFVAKLNPAGSALVYSTYLGGAHHEVGNGIAVDGAGNVTVVGTTQSANFPVANARQAAIGGGDCLITFGQPAPNPPTRAATPCSDGFVTQLSAAGTALNHSSYLGGNKHDTITAVAVDAAGSLYVTGATGSANLPTAGAVQGTFGGGVCASLAEPTGPCNDAFVAKLPSTGASLTYATYLGGPAADSGAAIALDATGAAYVTGSAASATFPTTAGAFQVTKGAGPESDAFVTKLAPSGAALAYSTFLGARELDGGSSIAVDGTGSAHVGGITLSEQFPVTRPVARFGGNQDAFVTRLHPSGGSLLYSTHYGGLGTEDAKGIGVDGANSTYVGGLTTFARTPEYFPTVNPFQGTFGGGFVPGTPNSGDGFAAKFVTDVPGRPLVTRISPRGGDRAGGTPVVISGTGFNGATAVRFGSTLARSFVVQSDQQIVAISPTLPEATIKVTVQTSGGTSAANPVAEFWAGEGSWSLTGALNTARSAHTTTLLKSGKVLAVGGRFSAASGVPLASAELYDPLTGTWSNTGSMAVARWAHTATLMDDGRVLVAGGRIESPRTTTSAEVYDPATGTWSTAGALAKARSLHAAALLGGPSCGANCGKVLVTGGQSSVPEDTRNVTETFRTSEMYNPLTNAWEPTVSEMVEARHTTEAAVLGDGRVLIAGGFGPTATAETFNPATATWTATANNMSFAKARPTVTAMADGNALVNNGWANGPVPSSDIFDYTTNMFRPVDLPITHRWNATALLLPNGRVMALAGGVGHHTAELYDAAANDYRSAGSLHIGRGASSVSAAGPGGTAVVLSSSTTAFEADRAVCGDHCGKVLVVGNSDDPVSELYTPASPTVPGPGYWLTASDGGIFAFGGAGFHGSAGSTPLNKPVVGMAATASGRGYWLVASDGGIFNYGDAGFFGSAGGVPLNKPVVGMAATPSGKGYWLVASDGGIFNYGDAAFYGSTGGTPLNQPVVGMAATPNGDGYWLVASDGGIFNYGGAGFHGSAGGAPLNQPVVGMAGTSTGGGYWLVASDGGIFNYGAAGFHGSAGGTPLNQPVVGMAAPSAAFASGYWLLAADGGIFNYGNAAFYGSAGGQPLNAPMVAMAERRVP